tara:strand:+ start:3484 stop:3771 length:288 start_codon:yes stop_codon:yes gene_type:complete
METDIGNPIEYSPTINEHKDDENKEEEYYFHPSEASNYPQQPMYQQPHPHPQPQPQESFDLFKNVDKSTWIIAFAVFLLGFFMGKTMQPVILRYT